MGRSHGTGQPAYFLCPVERRERTMARGIGYRERALKRHRMVRTGRERPLTAAQEGRGGSRVMQHRAEFRCLTCGHVGWSRHTGAGHLPLDLGRLDPPAGVTVTEAVAVPLGSLLPPPDPGSPPAHLLGVTPDWSP